MKSFEKKEQRTLQIC